VIGGVHVCVLMVIGFAYVFSIYRLDFGTSLMVWYFLFWIYLLPNIQKYFASVAIIQYSFGVPLLLMIWGRHGCDCKVVRFTTNYAISAYHH